MSTLALVSPSAHIPRVKLCAYCRERSIRVPPGHEGECQFHHNVAVFGFEWAVEARAQAKRRRGQGIQDGVSGGEAEVPGGDVAEHHPR